MELALRNLSISRTFNRLSVWARKTKLVNILVIILSVAIIVSGFATYVALSARVEDGASSNTALVLLTLDLFLVLALGIFVARRIVNIWIARRSGKSGSKLHIRLAILFGFVAITPAVLMMVFAVLLFALGVESWFSERVRTALVESSEVAEAYLEEHIQVIRADALAVAYDINSQWPQLNKTEEVLNRFLSSQIILRGLTEAVIFRQDMKVIAKAGYTFALQTGEQVPLSAIIKADTGDVAVLTGEGGDRVRALFKLEALPDTYLFVGRFIDANVLSRVSSTQDAVNEYFMLENRRFNFEVSFTLLFILVAVLLLMLSVWLGLLLANSLATPIVELIKASDRVSSGDLNVRVKEYPSSDEIDKLGRAFNRMTSRLSAQRKALTDANFQLDERRSFTEAVLSGVTSGVIGVDSKGCITLPNKAASNLLNISLDDEIGEPLMNFIPELAKFLCLDTVPLSKSIEEEVIIKRNNKTSTFIIRITVEQKNSEIIGYVFTFDDISALKTAERKAAWSGVARRIAHEIKNPLTPIQLSAERLKKLYLPRIKSDAKAFKLCTDTIIRYVGEIGGMVDEFTEFSRMPQPVMSKNNLVAITKSVVVLPQTAYSDLSFDYDISDQFIYISCDSAQVSRAISNVIKNAIESIEEKRIRDKEEFKGKILINIGKNEKVSFVEIIDNGVGLPEDEARQNLTDPYITTRTKGTGLGLAIVYKILEDHNAQLIIEDAPNGGARVVFNFLSFDKNANVSENKKSPEKSRSYFNTNENVIEQ